MTRSALLLAALAAGCTGDDATMTGLVTADIVQAVDTSGEPDTDAASLPDVDQDDTRTEPDVDTLVDVADDDAPDVVQMDLPEPDPPDVPDVGPDPVDVWDTPEPLDIDELVDVDGTDISDVADLDTQPDPDDVIDVPDVVVPPSPITLGTLAGATFAPLSDGVDLEITQGPQGGIHLEVGIDVAWDSEETKLSGVLSCRTRLGAKDVGFNETPNFILYRAPEGTYRSIVIPVYFQDFDAAVYVDETVAVSCSFLIGDVLLEDGAVVHLVDLF